jgi:hypothetical protein
MQWRAVVRRGPFASWTVVGDLAQRARNAPPSTWEEVATLIGRRTVAIERLATNYRTPAELAGLARRALGLAGHDPEGFPETVRSTGIGPRVIVSTSPQGEGLAVALRELSAAEGTIGVVVVDQHRGAAEAVVRATLSAGRSADVRIDDPRRVKGLEFDDLVVVAPEAILAASPLGAHDLYVALTRATRSLRIVTAEPTLPVLDMIGAHDVVDA